MSEQKLNRSEISSFAVYLRCFGPAERMGAVSTGFQPNRGNLPEPRTLHVRITSQAGRDAGATRLTPQGAVAYYGQRRVLPPVHGYSWRRAGDGIGARINDWKADYNETRLHSSLVNLTPCAFAAQLKEARKVA